MNTINLSDVKIPETFLKRNPSKKKIKAATKYIEKYGRPDKPIVLNNGVLVDKYVRYVAAKIKGLQEVPYVELQQMKYIVGKFDNCAKNYTWKNDRNIDINIGDKAVVKVKCKNNKIKFVYVTVVDIFSSDSLKLYNKHKSVIRKFVDK